MMEDAAAQKLEFEMRGATGAEMVWLARSLKLQLQPASHTTMITPSHNGGTCGGRHEVHHMASHGAANWVRCFFTAHLHAQQTQLVESEDWSKGLPETPKKIKLKEKMLDGHSRSS